MMNSEGRKVSKHEDGVDFISRMPDPILHLILSSLGSTKEAIRTSVLSTRWRYLWTSVPSIQIDCFSGSKHRGNLKKKKYKFREFVYWVLVNRTFDLDSFHLCCLNYYGTSTVGRWIHAAVARNVKQLDLSFCPKEESTVDFELPRCLVTCSSLQILRLKLDVSRLRLPNNLTNNLKGFPALRVLDLTSVDLFGLKEFFASLPLLEDLTLLECFVGMFIPHKISCPKLKKLRVINLEFENHCGGFIISCPKLEDLDITGHIGCNLLFECLDSLNKAVIQPKFMEPSKYVLFPGISHVESLLIDLCFFSQCINAASDPGLPNLKTLVLNTTMDAFTMNNFNRILKCYPKVESLKLIIEQKFDGPEESYLHEGDARRIFTSDLKRVEFFEFNGEKPKLVSSWHEFTLLEMGFSWGKKAN